MKVDIMKTIHLAIPDHKFNAYLELFKQWRDIVVIPNIGTDELDNSKQSYISKELKEQYMSDLEHYKANPESGMDLNQFLEKLKQ
jgi:hypothetical protein